MDRNQFKDQLAQRVRNFYLELNANAIAERIISSPSVSDATIRLACVSDVALSSLMNKRLDLASFSSNRDPRFQASSSSVVLFPTPVPTTIGPIIASSAWAPPVQESGSSNGFRPQVCQIGDPSSSRLQQASSWQQQQQSPLPRHFFNPQLETTQTNWPTHDGSWLQAGQPGYLSSSQLQQVSSWQQPPPPGFHYNPQLHGPWATPFPGPEFWSQEMAVDLSFLEECSQQSPPPPAIQNFSQEPYWKGQHLQPRWNPSFYGLHGPSAAPAGQNGHSRSRSSRPGSQSQQQQPPRIQATGDGDEAKKDPRLCQYHFLEGSCRRGSKCQFSHRYDPSFMLEKWREMRNAGSISAQMVYLRFPRDHSIDPIQTREYFSQYGAVRTVNIHQGKESGSVRFKETAAVESVLSMLNYSYYYLGGIPVLVQPFYDIPKP